MGSVGTEQLAAASDDDFVVLVTGFGPFGNRWAVNPSWEIASRLPPLIPVISKGASMAQTTLGSLVAGKNIRILVHPSPVRVSYSAVREIVPQLWKQYPRIDYMIHIGMASGREFYSVERRGHRRGYNMGDVDGIVLGDEKLKHENEHTEWIWDGLPDEILTSLDLDDVWRRWRSERPDDDVRISEDAGRYLCDFIYYNSLALLTRREEERRVVFFHVPVDSSDEAVKRGGDITVELIRSMVISGMMKKLTAAKES